MAVNAFYKVVGAWGKFYGLQDHDKRKITMGLELVFHSAANRYDGLAAALRTYVESLCLQNCRPSS